MATLRPSAQARPSPTSQRAWAARGFSLLELSVVITILSMVTLMASIAWNVDGDRAIDDEVRRLRALFRLAQEETRMNGRALVWEAGASGYAFRPLDASKDSTLPPPFAQRNWQPGVRYASAAPIVFAREPLLNPAQIVLGVGEREIRLALDPTGRLTRVE